MSQPKAPRAAGRSVAPRRAGGNRTLLIGALVVGVLVLLVGGGLLLSGNGPADSREQKFDDLGSNLHLQTPNDPLPKPFNSNPPTSGYHYGGGTAPWGIQTQPFPDTLSVHNLEHGGVIIHYRQGLDQPTVDKLTTLARQLQQRNPCLVMLPRPADQIDSPIILTAWTFMLKLPAFDEAAITNFFKNHVGHGPEAICQPGA